jgi:uncharacterized glyoxalase superfamily protein PhnB
MKLSSWCVPPSEGCTPSSAGGSAKISQPSPSSTWLQPKTSRRTARSSSGCGVYRSTWAPVIAMTGSYGACDDVQVPGWGVIPSIRVRNLADALAFYLGPLEFSLTSGGEEDNHVSITRGDARLMLESPADFYGNEYNAAIRERLGSTSGSALYIETSDLEGFQSRLQAAGARIVDPLADRPWGQAEFTVEDNEGNWLTFWQATQTGS